MSTRAEPATSYPRLAARTQRFTLGAPRTVTVTPDGARVVFLRSKAGTDPVTCLWTLDVATGAELLVADPRELLGDPRAQAVEELSSEERARRERSREAAAGVVGYSLDAAGSAAAFTLSGRLFRADLTDLSVRELPAAGPVLDPRLSPDGRLVGCLSGPDLRVVDSAGQVVLSLTEPDPSVSWGGAEFIAAEEMGRTRGFWWSPDGSRLLAARVDESPVGRYWLADPAHPTRAPRAVAYPAAGTANAEVSLWLVSLSGDRTPVDWDHDALPYLVAVDWAGDGGPLLLLMSRDQRRAEVHAVEVSAGTTSVLAVETDPAWVELASGVPTRLAGGQLLLSRDLGPARRLTVDATAVGPADAQLVSVVAAEEDAVVLLATSALDVQVARMSADGQVRWLTEGPGVRSAAAGGPVVAVSENTPDSHRTEVRILVDGEERHRLRSHQEQPPLRPRPSILALGPRRVSTAVLFPRDDVRPAGPLRVLMDPYGGPAMARVRHAGRLYLEPQWLADQGFVVVVADGRGTPGRGPDWDRSVHRDFAGPALQDQVDALLGAAGRYPGELDLDRVAIRGWSHGGYLAALAVLRRPDVFHAAVAGAPVTDWTLYDTFYTERYLGDPATDRQAYDQSSLLGDAAGLLRPLLLIHGLVDDNVVVAHSLRLSAALLAAGRPHELLALTGVTHLATQEEVAENLLLLELDFLARALAAPAALPPPRGG